MPTLTNLTSNGGSSATSFATASISPSAGRVVLVAVHAYISTGSVQPATPTVTGNGITYTLIRSRTVDTSGVDRANIFLFRGVSATAGAITIDFGAVTMTRCSWSVEQTDTDVDLSGANGMGAIAQVVDAISGSGATSLSVNYAPGITTGNAGYSVWGHQVQEGKTPRTSWTELADVTAVTLSCLESQWINGTDSAASASWVTGSRAGGIAVELKKLPPFIWWSEYVLQGGTTSLTMIPPTGTAAGDLEVIWVLNKNSSVDPADPSGGAAGTWHRIDSFEVGTGADGVGTGKIRITGWYRILATASTNTAITITGANRSIGGGMVYKLTAGGTWAVPTMSFGSDTDDTTTAFLATMADDLAAEVDEYLLSIGAFTAITSLNGRSLTVTGTTSSRLDGINSAGGAVGNEIFTWTDQRVVIAGSQSGASTTGATSGVGTTGGAAHIRIGLAGGNATASPAATALSSAVLQAVASASVAQTPAAVAGLVAVPQATARIDATVSPNAVALVAAVPSPAALTGASVAPAAVGAVIAVPAPVGSGGGSVAPGAVGAAIAVPGPSALAGASVNPAAVAGVAAVGQPGASVGAGPAAVALAGSVPQATPVAGGGAVAAPAVVPLAGGIPSPEASAGSAVFPGVVQVQMTVPAPGASGSAVSTPSVIALATGFPLPLTLVDGAASPDVVILLVTVPPAHADSGVPERDLTLTAAIQPGRLVTSVQSNRFVGTIEPTRLTGSVQWQ